MFSKPSANLQNFPNHHPQSATFAIVKNSSTQSVGVCVCVFVGKTRKSSTVTTLLYSAWLGRRRRRLVRLFLTFHPAVANGFVPFRARWPPTNGTENAASRSSIYTGPRPRFVRVLELLVCPFFSLPRVDIPLQ